MQESTARVMPRIADNIFEELWFGDDDPTRSDAEASESAAAAIAKAVGLEPFPAAAAQVLTLLGDEHREVMALVP